MIAAASAVLVFFVFHPWSSIIPSSIWLLDQDAATAFLGWQFFRGAPLNWPLGMIGDYLYPIGTSIGNTDSIPLFAYLFRPISALLPREAQYFGLWLLAGWIAQGVASFQLLASNDRRRDRAAWVGAVVFTTSPALMYRELMRHEALTFHAAVLLAFLLYRADWTERRPAVLIALLIGALGLIHPYLLVMIAAIAFATMIRAGLDLGRRALIHAALGLGGGVLVALPAIASAGYLADRSQAYGGFGECAADLFTFANPMSLSTFLRGFPVLPCRHEGYAYLGLGGVLVVCVALMTCARKKAPFSGIGGVTAWPLFLVCGGMAIFALSSLVTAFHNDLADLSGLYAYLEPIPSILRSSGRFVWPIYYLILWWAFERAIEGSTVRRGLIVVSTALFLQAVDTWPGFFARMHAPSDRASPSLDAIWPIAPTKYRHLAIDPPSLVGPGIGDPYVLYARLAAVHHLTFNSGYAARMDRSKAATYVARFHAELDGEAIATDTIYVFLGSPRPAALAKLRCTEGPGPRTCVAATNDDPFAQTIGHPSGDLR
jgi:hypothetical protein